MSTKTDLELLPCPVCGEPKPAHGMVHGAMVRPAVAALIARDHPGWGGGSLVCSECLHRFRTEYVEDVLEEDRGELSRIELEVVESFKQQELITQNLNRAFESGSTIGQRVADRVATFGGSWAFITIFFAILTAWMVVNSAALLRKPFDPYPFILLNLVLSCLAAIQAPIIIMSQNRQEAKDRLRSENDYRVNLKAELEIRHLNEKIDLLLSQQWRRLLEIQRIQMDLLEELGRRPRSV
jgi:uncharacterized membrane protein